MNQEKIIQAIAAYLENETTNAQKQGETFVRFQEPIMSGFTRASYCREIATEITAAIAPHLEVGAGWEDAPSWAEWRLDYSDGSHNFSKGYPSIVTTGVVKVECRPK